MKKLKVLQLIPNMGDGGAQQIVINYLDSFNNDNEIDMKLLVLSKKSNSKYDHYLSEKKYDVIYLDAPEKYSKIRLINKVLRVFDLNHRINKAIKIIKPDIVHIHTSVTLIFCLRFIKKNKKINNFITIHSNPLRDNGFSLKVIKNICKRPNVRVICLNNEQALLAKKHYGIEDYEIVRNGIKINEIKDKIIDRKSARKNYDISNNAFLVIGVGRLNKIKRFDILVRAFSKILKEKKDSMLVLAGDGEEKEALINLVNELGIKENVRFVGNQSNVIPLYCASDVLVMPSESEASPLVLLEAQICGLRCVVSDGVPSESIVTNNVIKMNKNASEDEWARQIVDGKKFTKKCNNLIDYDLQTSYKKIKELYLEYGEK